MIKEGEPAYTFEVDNVCEAAIKQLTSLNFRPSFIIIDNRSGLYRHIKNISAIRRLRRLHKSLYNSTIFKN